MRQTDVLVQAAHDKAQKRAAVAQQRAAHYKQRGDDSRRALRQAQRTVRAFEVLRLAGLALSIVDSEIPTLQGDGDTGSWGASAFDGHELVMSSADANTRPAACLRRCWRRRCLATSWVWGTCSAPPRRHPTPACCGSWSASSMRYGTLRRANLCKRLQFAVLWQYTTALELEAAFRGR